MSLSVIGLATVAWLALDALIVLTLLHLGSSSRRRVAALGTSASGARERRSRLSRTPTAAIESLASAMTRERSRRAPGAGREQRSGSAHPA